MLNCIDRRHRADVIQKCGKVIKSQEGVLGQLGFLFNEAKQYRKDFLLDPADPARGVPANDIEYQVLENSTLVQPVIRQGLWLRTFDGNMAEIAHELPPWELTRGILGYIRDDTSLPLEKRLTAAYDSQCWNRHRGRHSRR